MRRSREQMLACCNRNEQFSSVAYVGDHCEKVIDAIASYCELPRKQSQAQSDSGQCKGD